MLVVGSLKLSGENISFIGMSWDCTNLSIVKIVVCDLRRFYLRAKTTLLHNDNGEGTSLCGRVRVSCQRR